MSESSEGKNASYGLDVYVDFNKDGKICKGDLEQDYSSAGPVFFNKKLRGSYKVNLKEIQSEGYDPI